MNADQTEALIGMLLTFGLLVLMVLPSVIGIVRDRRIDRQIRKAQEDREARQAPESVTRRETQKSSSRSTVPSTATWYAEGRRSKKLVNS
ncbi:hypothetical protein [Streptomyces flaveolus]|uniref:hypothetical protein n=1 Tax=Streptomyces flaveolus TaxID=67297 RepID=UPI0016709029|nr:hypothetical protein [Streptomyces flaveolus]